MPRWRETGLVQTYHIRTFHSKMPAGAKPEDGQSPVLG